jgi:hypothetical protein
MSSTANANMILRCGTILCLAVASCRNAPVELPMAPAELSPGVVCDEVLAECADGVARCSDAIRANLPMDARLAEYACSSVLSARIAAEIGAETIDSVLPLDHPILSDAVVSAGTRGFDALASTRDPRGRHALAWLTLEPEAARMVLPVLGRVIDSDPTKAWLRKQFRSQAPYPPFPPQNVFLLLGDRAKPLVPWLTGSLDSGPCSSNPTAGVVDDDHFFGRRRLECANALAALGFIGDQTTANRIARCIDHNDWLVSWFAIWSLARLPNTPAVENALRSAGATTWSTFVRDEATRALQANRSRELDVSAKLDEALRIEDRESFSRTMTQLSHRAFPSTLARISGDDGTVTAEHGTGDCSTQRVPETGLGVEWDGRCYWLSPWPKQSKEEEGIDVFIPGVGATSIPSSKLLAVSDGYIAPWNRDHVRFSGTVLHVETSKRVASPIAPLYALGVVASGTTVFAISTDAVFRLGRVGRSKWLAHFVAALPGPPTRLATADGGVVLVGSENGEIAISNVGVAGRLACPRSCRNQPRTLR